MKLNNSKKSRKWINGEVALLTEKSSGGIFQIDKFWWCETKNPSDGV
jgi:hypothetical protein